MEQEKKTDVLNYKVLKIRITKTYPSLFFAFVYDGRGKDITEKIAGILKKPFYEGRGLRVRGAGMTPDAWLRNWIYIETGKDIPVEVVKK